MRRLYYLLLACVLPSAAFAQDDLSQLFKDTVNRRQPVLWTFKSTRIINGESTEMLKKHELDFRVSHRFGDFAGSNGGGKTFFGMDNSSDIRIAFEYGVTDDFTVGISRAKGSGNLSQLYEVLGKYRLVQQTQDNHIPVSVAAFGNVVTSAMKSSTTESDPSYFGRFSDRMSYTAQVIISRKFGKSLSLAVLPSYVHRNRVEFMDMNNMFAVGVGGRLRLSNRVAFVADYFVPFRSRESKDYFASMGRKYYNSLGVGVEIETGGHVFHLNFTNATATLENQFIPETTSTWLDGQYRWGFNISRRFSMKHKK
ncbi:hypothetical protein LX64_02986 [Chitinophaga skermanii]|uniref:DUF5777 domain-containing protein n=1 Tax=Chitinophaga skermanii TaxID=331697 RepID=A0A327QJE7_9BACT|nr:DUF5777 family beta-barrel protein [Chitinophaga skermanii]RAJ04108.1 hypothetical protein LX64_02986 [Chitinophaga skermanii]